MIHVRARQLQQLALARHAQLTLSPDHCFAFSFPALLNARSKTSRPRVNYPTLACSAFNSASAIWLAASFSKAETMFSMAGSFHWMIYFGCTLLLGQLHQRVLAPHGCQFHFGHELRPMGRSRSSHHFLHGRQSAAGRDDDYTYGPVQKSQTGSFAGQKSEVRRAINGRLADTPPPELGDVT